MKKISSEIRDLETDIRNVKNIEYLKKLDSETGYGEFRPSCLPYSKIIINNHMFHVVRKLLIELFEMERVK